MTLKELAEDFGASESSLKLLITTYLGYIFGAIYRRFFYGKPNSIQNIFFTTIGLSLIYWNYGNSIIHSLICICVQWLIFNVIGTSKMSVAVSFPFQLGYLLFGYFLTSTEGYDINWSMPHCILTLRLIGLSFDVYDGHRDQSKVSAEQKTLLIEDVPSLLEMCGFCYFYGGFHLGPQFPIRRYRQMLNGELSDRSGERPKSVYPALRRCASGTLILILHLLANSKVPESTYFRQGFLDSGFLWVFTVVCIRGHLLLYQYVAIWMINEGACILSGLGFHKEGDKVKWDAVRNVKLRKFAFSRSFNELIEAFNINTNQWVARYVYKRLRFLGNRSVSHISTLMFLAAWHGYHEGYFTCFLYEFLVITVEKPVRAELNETAFVKKLYSSKSTSWIPSVVGFLYVRLIFGYCLLDFSLRKWKLYAPIYRSMFYYGHIFYIVMWILLQIYLSMKPKPDKKKE